MYQYFARTYIYIYMYGSVSLIVISVTFTNKYGLGALLPRIGIRNAISIKNAIFASQIGRLVYLCFWCHRIGCSGGLLTKE